MLCAVELLASKLQLSPEQLKVKLATGAGSGAVTVTAWVLVLDPPPSVTVSVTLYVPPVPKACVAVWPVPLAPSPQVQP